MARLHRWKRSHRVPTSPEHVNSLDQCPTVSPHAAEAAARGTLTARAKPPGVLIADAGRHSPVAKAVTVQLIRQLRECVRAGIEATRAAGEADPALDDGAVPGRAFVEPVRELTGGAGVRVVFDAEGAATFHASMQVLARARFAGVLRDGARPDALAPTRHGPSQHRHHLPRRRGPRRHTGAVHRTHDEPFSGSSAKNRDTGYEAASAHRSVLWAPMRALTRVSTSPTGRGSSRRPSRKRSAMWSSAASLAPTTAW